MTAQEQEPLIHEEQEEQLVRLTQNLFWVPRDTEDYFSDMETIEEGRIVLTDKETAFDLVKYDLAEIMEKDVSKNK